jgi:hypothetical protein
MQLQATGTVSAPSYLWEGPGSVRSKRYFRLSSAATVAHTECQSRRCHCYGRSSSLHIMTTHIRCSAAWHARGSHILLPSQMSILVALATFLFFPVFAIAQGLEPVKHSNAEGVLRSGEAVCPGPRDPWVFFSPLIFALYPTTPRGALIPSSSNSSGCLRDANSA